MISKGIDLSKLSVEEIEALDEYFDDDYDDTPLPDDIYIPGSEIFKNVFNKNVDMFKLLSRPFLKIAQCANMIENKPQDMVRFLGDIDIAAVEQDFNKEIEWVKANEKNPENIGPKTENLLRAVHKIKAQSEGLLP